MAQKLMSKIIAPPIACSGNTKTNTTLTIDQTAAGRGRDIARNQAAGRMSSNRSVNVSNRS